MILIKMTHVTFKMMNVAFFNAECHINKCCMSHFKMLHVTYKMLHVHFKMFNVPF
jgi:hypothetical protein